MTIIRADQCHMSAIFVQMQFLSQQVLKVHGTPLEIRCIHIRDIIADDLMPQIGSLKATGQIVEIR